MKKTCNSILSTITKEKPLLSSRINELIKSKSDYVELLNELTNIYNLCKKEIQLNQSVWVINDDDNGIVIEILPNEEYNIKLNNGNIVKKSKNKIIVNDLPLLHN